MKLWRIGRCGLALGLTVVALLAIACGDDDEAPAVTAAATRTATSTLTPSSTAQPAATSTSATTPPPTSTIPPTATEPPREGTGVPVVDRIISAVLGGDLAAVEALVQLRSVACGAQQGIGSPPPCPAGEPAGTMVQVLPVATCEGEWRPASAVQPSFQPLVSANPRLYAVYGMPEQFQQRIPDGQYVAVFSRDAGSQGTLGAGVVIAGARIAGLWFGCGAKADQIVPAGTSTILPPRT